MTAVTGPFRHGGRKRAGQRFGTLAANAFAVSRERIAACTRR